MDATEVLPRAGAGAGAGLPDLTETELLPRAARRAGLPEATETEVLHRAGRAGRPGVTEAESVVKAGAGARRAEVTGTELPPPRAAGRPGLPDPAGTQVIPAQRGGTARRDARHGSADTEHTHDPHEVTVQLDGTGWRFGAGPGQAEHGEPGGREGSEGPVFVDESGRRGRRLRRIGIAIGLACAAYAAVIVATLLSGNSAAPWLPVPREQEDVPASKVDSPPLPSRSAQPSVSGSPAPGVSASASGATTASPGRSADAPGASASPGRPGTSADPGPSATSTTRNPGSGVTPSPRQSVPVSIPSAASPSAGGDPSPDPSPSPDGGSTGPGMGSVADGPSTPTPVAEGPDTNTPVAEDAAGSSSLSRSPEYVL
ncbi:hypothetical protein [Streptomyces sp. Ru72]|uniref:hypothetical protein n=1 Tax=Streptomyces sp. Ru72 TaxID=2080747 RepID=UPI000CDD4A85|nr:hypothetical protein [Streptomyces sp. Ru72]POX48855.1 hypothetical protein C3488_19280 [Streptomyces sp. Ru72]